MEFINFSYRGILLSEYNCIPCKFNEGGGISIEQSPKLVFNTVKQPGTGEYLLYGTEYESYLTTTFSICKNNCNGAEQYFSLEEVREIMRWLNTKEYQIFVPTDTQFDDMYFLGSFTSVNKIKHGDDVIGFELTFDTKNSYALSDRTIQYNITNIDDVKSIFNDSDEYGYLYPTSMEIEINEDGDFAVENSLDNRAMYIGNCIQGEKITIDTKNKIITTSNATHDIYEDFNYKFFRFNKTYEQSVNKISFSLPCKIKMQFSLIRKVGIV